MHLVANAVFIAHQIKKCVPLTVPPSKGLGLSGACHEEKWQQPLNLNFKFHKVLLLMSHVIKQENAFKIA